MHRYRTHTCGELRAADVGRPARLSGWVHRKRDHGQLLFIDLRDNFGLTQCVVNASSPCFEAASGLRLESVVTLTGTVVARGPEAVNPRLPTGEIELAVDDREVRLTVLDDGVGIGPEAAESGLRNARRRATALGGRLELGPRQPRGTSFVWRVPLS